MAKTEVTMENASITWRIVLRGWKTTATDNWVRGCRKEAGNLVYRSKRITIVDLGNKLK
jgi:hypothetical protein